MSLKEAKDALAVLWEHYHKDRPPNPALRRLYEAALHEVPAPLFAAACNAFLLDPEPPFRMPTPGQILDRARAIAGELRPERMTSDEALELEADAAWASVRRRIRTCGPYFDPHLSPAELWAVNAIGGWDRLCDAPSRDLDFLGKDFVRLYKERRKHPAVAQGAGAVAALAAGRTALPETVDGIPIIDASDVIQ